MEPSFSNSRHEVGMPVPTRYNKILLDFPKKLADGNLRISIPLDSFDQICMHAGNAYQAIRWIIVHCDEVGTLSVNAIEQYLNMMALMLADKNQEPAFVPNIKVRCTPEIHLQHTTEIQKNIHSMRCLCL